MGIISMRHIEQFGQKWWGMAILLAVPIFISLLPLAHTHIFFSEDAFSALYPGGAFLKQSINNDDSFLWNPDNFSGFPTFAGAAAGLLSPIYYFVFSNLAVFDAYHLLAFFYLVFGSCLVSYFLRMAGVGVFGSYIGGLAYAFGNWRIANDLAIVSVLPLLPLLLIALFSAGGPAHNEAADGGSSLGGKIFKRSRIWFFVGGVGGGLIVLAGHYHYVLEVITAVALSAPFIGWVQGKTGWKNALRSTLNFVVLMAIVGAIGLIRFIPAFVYVDYSVRSGGLSFFDFASAGITLVDPILFFSPYLEFPPFIRDYVNFSEQMYIGILPLFFVFAGFSFRLVRSLVSNGIQSKYKYAVFFSYALLASVVAAMAYSPLAFILQNLPILNFLNSPSRWMFVAYFWAALLAGIGFENLVSRNINESFKSFTKIFLWGGVIIIFVILIGWLFTFVFGVATLSFLTKYFDSHFYSANLKFPLAYYHRYIELVFNQSRLAVDILNPKVFLPILFFIISLWLVRSFLKKKWELESLKHIFVLITVLNLVSVFSFYHVYVSRKAAEKVPRIAEFLQKSDFPKGRVLSFLPGQSEFFKLAGRYRFRVPMEASLEFWNEFMASNTNLNYGISNIDYFDNFMSRRMARLVAYIGGVHTTVGDALAYYDILPEEKVKILSERRNLLNFSGTRFIVSAYPFDENIFPRVFETSVVPPFNIPIAVYENKQARPLFYFADSVEIILEDEIAAFEKLKMIPEEGFGVFIECDFSNTKCSREHLVLLKNINGQDEIEVKTKKNTVSILKTKSETPQFLVFSENHLPGWKAYIDGEETPIYTVGSVYMGIMVPEGEHEVKFEFTYRMIAEEFLKKYFWKCILC